MTSAESPPATEVGVLAEVVQFLGLARWPFLVPALARAYTDPESAEATREATKGAGSVGWDRPRGLG